MKSFEILNCKEMGIKAIAISVETDKEYNAVKTLMASTCSKQLQEYPTLYYEAVLDLTNIRKELLALGLSEVIDNAPWSLNEKDK